MASEFIKPNDRLSSFERLEIYNRQYWFRTLDCLYDDYPGLRAVVGERKFMKLATAYLTVTRQIRTPSAISEIDSNSFCAKSRTWSAPRQELAIDMVRFEWAQVVAFDGPANPPLVPDDILDTPATKLRLNLQPYLSLLELNFAVDDFLIAVKKRESAVLRGEASNAMDGAPKAAIQPETCKASRDREKIYLAVHRHDNVLYYKRLELEAFADPDIAGPRGDGGGCLCRSGHRERKDKHRLVGSNQGMV